MDPDAQNSPQPQQNNASDNAIFMTHPTPPPSPEEKRKTAVLVTIGLIVGFAAIIAGIFLIFFAMANSAASQYRSAASAHVGELSGAVEEIDIVSILSLRDITGNVENIEQLARDRPRLASVILAETTSASYRSAEELAGQVDAYYETILSFTQSLPYLLDFAQLVEDQQNDLDVLRKERPADSPGNARTLAGSIDTLAEELEAAEAPDPLVSIRNELADTYRQLAEGYRDMAEAFEQPAVSQSQAERRIDVAQREITRLSTLDFAQRVIEQREQLQDAARTLQERLL